MHKIDVHIIKSGRGYYDECIKSLKNEPINIHELNYSPDFGRVRMDGFSTGSSPYVAAVDDDDIVIEGIFERALEVMEQGYTAYYSNHYIMDASKNVYGKWFDTVYPPIGFAQEIQMHHVTVFRRDIIEPILPYLEGIKASHKKLLNLKCIHDGTVFGEDIMGLYWRIHDKNMHKETNKNDNPQQWKDKVKEYQTKILEKTKI